MVERAETTAPVFLVDQVPAAGDVEVRGAEAKHAVTVRRTRVGECVLLADGAGTVADCAVTEVQPGRTPVLRVVVRNSWYQPPPSLRVTVAQALAKGERGELAVELATEAGVDTLLPWRAARSIARWDDGERGARALARWRDTVRAAAKQSRRSHVPEVTEPRSTAELADRIRDAALGLVLDATAAAGLGELTLPTEGELIMVVGPEGGVTSAERETLVNAGARPVRLGPHVLRTSTAGVVALSALGALTSRWNASNNS